MIASNFWIRFFLAALATWRVTHLLAKEDGPADMIVRLRRLLGESFAGSLMDCFLCLSLWIAAPAAVFVSRRPVTWMFSWLAVSGAACLMEGFSERRMATEPFAQNSEGGRDYVLRTETSSAQKYNGE